jgi:thioredoxin 1
MTITFNDYINGDKPVVVDFYAEWCAPCKTMQPILKEIKTLAGNTVTILKMDVDKNKFYADKFNIQSIPTLIIFKQGKVLWRKSGVVLANEVIPQLAQHLA